MELDRARSLLTASLEELDRSRAFAVRARTDTGADADSEGAFGTHPGDAATDVSDAMDAELLLATTDDQRRLVRDALDRVDAGTYGACAVCGHAIDDERLEARPEAQTCRQHADVPVVA